MLDYIGPARTAVELKARILEVFGEHLKALRDGDRVSHFTAEGLSEHDLELVIDSIKSFWVEGTN